MEKRVVKPEVIKSVSEMAPGTHFAYYMEPKNGGYQLHRISIQEDIVVADESIENPDGWPEVLGYLEVEFMREHFSQ